MPALCSTHAVHSAQCNHNSFVTQGTVRPQVSPVLRIPLTAWHNATFSSALEEHHSTARSGSSPLALLEELNLT
eukprot:383172-Pelagomonas_calceolata.AAC.3